MIMIGARSLVAERKVLLIPEGLNGERVDAAVARMLGLPRSRVVDLIGAGHVLLDGASINKSDRVSVGSMLEVELADQPRLATVRPEQVEGVVIVYDDDDIVVIDKPVGVAAHPSLGLERPRRSQPPCRCRLPDLDIRRFRATRHRAAAGRGHLRADGGRQERAGVHDLEASIPVAERRQDLPRAGARPSRSVYRHHRGS